MNRVFMLEQPRKPMTGLEKASRFGELQVLFDHTSRRASVFKPNNFMDDVHDALERVKFDPTLDTIVMTGSMNNVVLFALAAREYCEHAPLRTLLFNASIDDYELTELLIGEQEDADSSNGTEETC